MRRFVDFVAATFQSAITRSWPGRQIPQWRRSNWRLQPTTLGAVIKRRG